MTLTEAAFWTKRFGIIGFVTIGIFVLILFVVFATEETVLPPEYLTSNFGCTEKKDEFLQNELVIPTLDIKQDSEMIFELQTNTGKVDTLPRIVNVYKYVNLSQSLNSQGDAKILAKKMGFDPDKLIRQGTTDYLWRDNTSKRSLDIKAKGLNFELKTDPEFIRELSKSYDLPSEKEAQSIATNALRSLGLLNTAYSTTPVTTHLIDINPDGTYSQADSLIDAELVRVDFFRKIPMITIASNIEGAKDMVTSLTSKDLSYEEESKIVNDAKVEVYNFSTLVTYQNPVKSNISVYVGPKPRDAKRVFADIYQIEYTNWTIDETSCGTYELIAPSAALEKIQNGEGSLVYLNSENDEIIQYTPQTVKKVIVSNIYITYYEGLNEQNFLQPIYMVEGQAELKDGSRADYHIYYPAINYGIVQDRIELPAAPVENTTPSLFQ